MVSYPEWQVFSQNACLRTQRAGTETFALPGMAQPQQLGLSYSERIVNIEHLLIRRSPCIFSILQRSARLPPLLPHSRRWSGPSGASHDVYHPSETVGATLMRRKGERKLEKSWPDWGKDHPIHNAIARGSGWFNAWYSQACTPWSVVERRTGIPADRLIVFDQGEIPTVDEIEALAMLWRCPVEQIIASLSD